MPGYLPDGYEVVHIVLATRLDQGRSRFAWLVGKLTGPEAPPERGFIDYDDGSPVAVSLEVSFTDVVKGEVLFTSATDRTVTGRLRTSSGKLYVQFGAH